MEGTEGLGDLGQVLNCIASIVSEVSAILRSAGSGYSGGTNAFGDNQLEVDVQVDKLIFERLAACPAVQAAASEEQPEVRPLPGSGYSVVFDPLDGSSILGANFAVGSIFGVWPGGSPVGRCGRDQAAAAYAVYGPQTILVWARPKAHGLGSGSGAGAGAGAGGGQGEEQQGGDGQQQQANGTGEEAGSGHQGQGETNGPATEAAGTGAAGLCRSSRNGRLVQDSHEVQEFLLLPDGRWQLARSGLGVLPVSRTFAPANLRAASANAEYAALVRKWTDEAFTLRYTGGMVPDVHHILAKGSGVFCNPCSEAAPAKLRLLFECAPLAFIVEAAGGSSSTGQCSVLDVEVRTPADRSKICLGSSQLVEDSLPAMQAA